MRIRLLDEQTAAKIAAGEVVVDPAAAVKELVENAIDAKATAISIHIEDGGKSKIEVTDNGIGIEAEDVELAFARHGTSKIRVMDDLDQLVSLGFRGEALASMAAVANITLKTSARDDGLGTIYRKFADKEIKESIAWARGTSILVENLFYNTPARFKHLKKAGEENRKIIRIIQVLSMSHPDVSFTLTLDGAHYMKTPGSGDLLAVLHTVFGSRMKGQWIRASYSNEPLKLDGYLASPYDAGRTRDQQFLFINNRYINEPRINRAVEDAYDGMLMVNRHPSFVLHISLPSHMLDVNIHPAKTKVQIRNDSLFMLLLKDGIRQLLRKNLEEKKTTPIVEEGAAPFRVRETVDVKAEVEPVKWVQEVKEYQQTKSLAAVDVKTEVVPEEIPIPVSATADMKFEKELSEEAPIDHKLNNLLKDTKLLGQLFSTYIMLEKDHSVFILVDQHAAHERILYERMLDAYKGKTMECQTILPVQFQLSPDEYLLVMDNLEMFASLGFDVSAFGQNKIALRSVPMLLGDPAEPNLLLEILEDERLEVGSLKDRVILAACKKAVKANQKMSKEEIETLLDQLVVCRVPFTCPHGRPIVVTMDKYGVEKLFKRVT